MITISQKTSGGGATSSGMIERTRITYTALLPQDTDYIATLQEVTTNVTLTENVWYYPRKVTLTSVNDLSLIEFSVTGTDENNNVVNETGVFGPNNETIQFDNWYKTITEISVSASVTGLEVGIDDAYLVLDRDDAQIHEIAPECPIELSIIGLSEYDDIYVYIDRAGVYSVTWPSEVYWSDGVLPRLSIYGKDWLRFNTLDTGTTIEGALMTLQNLQAMNPRFIDFVSTGATFAPETSLSGGTNQWDWGDGTISYEEDPIKDFGSAGSRTNRLTVSPWEAISTLNVSGESLDSIVFNCPEAVNLYRLNIKESSLREVILEKLPGLTEVDGIRWTSYIDYKGAQSLERIEFLDVPNLESVDLRNAASLEEIDLTRCPKVTNFNVSHSASIKHVNLAGLDQLTTLTLSYYYNYANYYGLRNLETVNVSGCTGLTYFELGDVTKVGMELDLTGAPNIETVRLWRWNGISLDLSNNTALESLYLHRFYNYNNCESVPYLETLDLTGCTGLATFDMRYLSTSSTVNLDIDLSDSTNLTTVIAWSPQITSLDVSNTPIQTLQLSYYYNYANHWGSNRMTTLDITGCTSLQSIIACDTTAITSVDASDLTALTSVTIWNSEIQTLDISNAPVQDLSLGYFYSGSYKWGCPSITSVTLTGCTQLQNIEIGTSSQLAQSFDFTGITSLQTFTSWLSGITGLNFTNCTNLTSVITAKLISASIYNSDDIATMTLTGCTSLVTYISGGDEVQTLDFTDCTPLQQCRVIKSDYLASVNLNGLQNLITIELGYGYYSSYYPIAHAIALSSVSMVGCAGAPTVRICGGIMSSLDFSGQNRLGDVYIFNLTQLTTVNFANSNVQTITGSDYNTTYPGDDYYDLPLLQSITLTNCTSLTALDLQHSGNITSLDLSTCSNLQSLYINGSGVQQINLSGCSNLTAIRTGYRWAGSHYTRFGECTNLNSITLTGVTSLQVANLTHMGAVTTLDASPCTALQELYCYGSPLLQTVNCNGLSNLTSLRVGNTSYPSPSLTSIDLTGCSSITRLDAQHTGALSVDFSPCTALRTLYLQGSNIGTLDVSGLTNLQDVICYDGTGSCNLLTSVNVTGCTSLQTLDVRVSAVTTLNDLHTCSSLQTLMIRGCTALTSVDVHDVTSLTKIDAYGTSQLCPAFNTLDVSGCTALNSVLLNSSGFNSAGVDQILSDLDTNGTTNGTVDLRNTTAPGATGLTAKTNLEGKGWTVQTD